MDLTICEVPDKPGLLSASDSEGNSMRYRYYDGHNYSEGLYVRSTAEVIHGREKLRKKEKAAFPVDVKGHLEKIDNFECRENDVILATYPKSGLYVRSTSKVIYGREKLRKKEKPGKKIGEEGYEEAERGNFDPNNVTYGQLPGIFIVHRGLPKQAKEGKGKIINICRNPKDVAVSYYLFYSSMKWSPYSGDMAGFLRFFLLDDHQMCDSWFNSVKSWEEVRQKNHRNVLLLRYEDVKTNFYDNIVKISKFLELNHDDDFLRKVEKKCTFSAMKNDATIPDRQWEYIAEGGILPVYRKGSIGDWKNYLTVAQSEEFDAVFDRKMAGVDVSFTYE